MGKEWNWKNDRTRNGGIDEVPLDRVTGRLLLCGKHYIAPAPDDVLAAHSIQRVVCLNEQHELIERYPHYVEWLQSNPCVQWTPIPDLGAPGLATLVALVDHLTQAVISGETVVVHCGAGIGRAGTLASAVLIGLGSSVTDACLLVGLARPGAGPESGPQRELIDAYGASITRSSAP
jgi:protein-tyrosine phosphatase